MKTAPGPKSHKGQRLHAALPPPPTTPAPLPQEVQHFLRQFREWEESFHSPTQRLAYIKHVCQRIVAAFHPEKIILFGSHAYGTPTPDSDVDLLIIMPFEGSPVRQALKISNDLGLMTPMDLLLRTPEQVQERLHIDDPFIRDIVQRGMVMYEANHR